MYTLKTQVEIRGETLLIYSISFAIVLTHLKTNQMITIKILLYLLIYDILE